MTPAQRLAATFAGQPPDRVPVMPKIWLNVAARLTGIDLRTMIEDPLVAMRSVVEAAICARADGARLFLFPARGVVEEDGRLVEIDATGRRLGEIDLSGGLATHLDRADAFRFDDPSHVAFHTARQHAEPLVKDLADIERMVVPHKQFYESAGYADFVRQVQAYAGDRVGLCGDCDSATLAFCVSLRGMHQALLDLMDAPRLVHAMMDKGVAYAIERGKFFIDAGVRILRLNDSVANMSVISPRTWKEYILPRMETVCDELHGYAAGVRIYCHICGNVLPIVDLLVEAGLDCIGPLDPLGGFTVADVRRRAGDQIVLMGGVNTLSFVRSTPEEIRAEALRCIHEGDRNGRFVLGSGCALPAQSRRENIEALVAAAEAYSRAGEWP